MHLSNQAIGAIMMALQKSLMEQSDIVPVLQAFELGVDEDNKVTVKNPPIVRYGHNWHHRDGRACKNATR